LAGASDRRNEVAEVKRTVADNEAKTQARKAEIEAELSEIQPILDSAKQAVGQIKNEHLNEIRSLNAPPEAIADVLAAVLMILGVQDLSWLSMKKFLSNRGVKDDILHYDAKRMSEEIRKNVAKLIKKKSASFEAANIQRVSIAAAPMAAWVKANIKYSLVIEKIEPLDRELEEEVRMHKPCLLPLALPLSLILLSPWLVLPPVCRCTSWSSRRSAWRGARTSCRRSTTASPSSKASLPTAPPRRNVSNATCPSRGRRWTRRPASSGNSPASKSGGRPRPANSAATWPSCP